jgi:hypothetical protein
MTRSQWKSYLLFLTVGALLGIHVIRDSSSHHFATEVFVVAGGLIAVAVGLLRARRFGSSGKVIDRGEATESVCLQLDERAIYNCRVTNPLLLAFSGGLLLLYFLTHITVLELIGGLGWLYVIGGVSIVDVQVDSRGVLVSAWPLRHPQRFVSIERITGARAIRVGRSRLWGLRWLARDRTWAFLIRGRRALQVSINNGEALLVTVPDPSTAAGLINDLRTRHN